MMAAGTTAVGGMQRRLGLQGRQLLNANSPISALESHLVGRRTSFLNYGQYRNICNVRFAHRHREMQVGKGGS